MEQKRVTFEVAKVLYEAGYWEEKLKGYIRMSPYDFQLTRLLINTQRGFCELTYPTYLEVWLWLWREKGIYIDIAHYYSSDEVTIWDDKYNKVKSIECFRKYQDPEEAIEAAIKYLVDNGLLK